MLLIAILITNAVTGFSQQSKRNTYLIVRFESGVNYNNDRYDRFFYILAEGGNPYATDVYRLLPFKTGTLEVNTGGSFFYGEIDSVSKYYNYFNTHTAAMEYMAKKGWQLVTVISEIYTEVKRDYKSLSDNEYPIVSSKPVYYFKKELE